MDWSPETGSLDLTTLRDLYASKTLKPADVVRAVYRRINRFDHVWISQVPQADALARAAELERTGRGLPLYGIPFAVKDNIDVAGLPTTAACKEFARTPQRSATVVNRLTQAGAILIGKGAGGDQEHPAGRSERPLGAVPGGFHDSHRPLLKTWRTR